MVGMDVVEITPKHDVNQISCITAGRLIVNLIGAAVRADYFATRVVLAGQAGGGPTQGRYRRRRNVNRYSPQRAINHFPQEHFAMSHILHRQLRGTLPLVASARGIRIVDDAGKDYLDASGGAAVSCLDTVIRTFCAAMHAQIDRFAYAHTSFFTTAVAEELADALISPRRQDVARVSGVRRLRGDRSGAQAGAPVLRRDRATGAARTSSRAGRAITATRWARWRLAATNGAAAIRAAADRRRRTCRPLRVPRPPRRRNAGSVRCSDLCASSRRSSSARPGVVIAFVAETVGGATLGCRAAGAGLLSAGIRELCDRHGILLIARRSDVRHGPHRHAVRVEQEGIVPD